MVNSWLSYGPLVGGTGNSWGWELNSNRIYNAGEIILPVCNIDRSVDATVSEKFEETDKVEFNIDEGEEVFDEQNELNKLYHYPNSRNFSKFQEKFKCPSEFYMSKFRSPKFNITEIGSFHLISVLFNHLKLKAFKK